LALFFAAIARASRNKTESGKQKLQQSYVALLSAASRIVGQARQFSHCTATPAPT